MGFDDNEAQYEFHGNKSEITRQIGNAVGLEMRDRLDDGGEHQFVQ